MRGRFRVFQRDAKNEQILSFARCQTIGDLDGLGFRDAARSNRASRDSGNVGYPRLLRAGGPDRLLRRSMMPGNAATPAVY